MPTYEVGRHEVHLQYITVEADSPAAALVAAGEDNGDYTYFEFSHILDSNLWSCEELDAPDEVTDGD